MNNHLSDTLDTMDIAGRKIIQNPTDLLSSSDIDDSNSVYDMSSPSSSVNSPQKLVNISPKTGDIQPKASHLLSNDENDIVSSSHANGRTFNFLSPTLTNIEHQTRESENSAEFSSHKIIQQQTNWTYYNQPLDSSGAYQDSTVGNDSDFAAFDSMTIGNDSDFAAFETATTSNSSDFVAYDGLFSDTTSQSSRPNHNPMLSRQSTVILPIQELSPFDEGAEEEPDMSLHTSEPDQEYFSGFDSHSFDIVGFFQHSERKQPFYTNSTLYSESASQHSAATTNGRTLGLNRRTSLSTSFENPKPTHRLRPTTLTLPNVLETESSEKYSQSNSPTAALTSTSPAAIGRSRTFSMGGSDYSPSTLKNSNPQRSGYPSNLSKFSSVSTIPKRDSFSPSKSTYRPLETFSEGREVQPDTSNTTRISNLHENQTTINHHVTGDVNSGDQLKMKLSTTNPMRKSSQKPLSQSQQFHLSLKVPNENDGEDDLMNNKSNGVMYDHAPKSAPLPFTSELTRISYDDLEEIQSSSTNTSLASTSTGILTAQDQDQDQDQDQLLHQKHVDPHLKQDLQDLENEELSSTTSTATTTASNSPVNVCIAPDTVVPTPKKVYFAEELPTRTTFNEPKKQQDRRDKTDSHKISHSFSIPLTSRMISTHSIPMVTTKIDKKISTMPRAKSNISLNTIPINSPQYTTFKDPSSSSSRRKQSERRANPTKNLHPDWNTRPITLTVRKKSTLPRVSIVSTDYVKSTKKSTDSRRTNPTNSPQIKSDTTKTKQKLGLIDKYEVPLVSNDLSIFYSSDDEL